MINRAYLEYSDPNCLLKTEFSRSLVVIWGYFEYHLWMQGQEELEKLEDEESKKKRGRGHSVLFDYIDTILSRLNLLIARAHVTIASTDAITNVTVLDNHTTGISAIPASFIDIIGRIIGIRKTITIDPEA